MTVVEEPQGWSAVETHLIDLHGFAAGYVDGLDAEDARRLHRWAHEHDVFERRHSHG